MPLPARRDIRIVLLADTHLGFDEPIRPRIDRRRRGPDFFANFERVLEGAREREADLVVHGGDLFFRSRVPPSIIDRVYRRLLRFAAGGIPLLIIPGNHERSMLPPSLFLQHPHLHVFHRPETKVLRLRETVVAVSGVPCARREARSRFPALLAETRWSETPCDLRLLCLHQAIEGATVGPGDFTFGAGADVIPRRDLPPEFDAVLSGHIHRRQILFRHRPDGTRMPVVYPGSVERTSFAERQEPKGYFDLEISRSATGRRGPMKIEFVPLPTRPMEEIVLGEEIIREVEIPRGAELNLDPQARTSEGVDGGGDPETAPAGDAPSWRRALQARLAALPPDAVVRVRCEPGILSAVRDNLTERLLREIAPPTMNVQLAGEHFARGRHPAG